MLGVAATTVVAVVVAPRIWRAEPRITQAASVSPNMWLAVPSPTPMATPTPIPAPAPAPSPIATSPRPPAISTAAPTSPTQAAARVDREVQLIEQARNAVRQQRPRDGLLAAMQYHRLFPNGQLAQEADLLVIEAYVALNDHALAQRTIAAFRARYPASPHLERVEAMGLRLRSGPN